MNHDNDFIILKNCRIAFPSIHKRPVIRGEEGKFGATFLLDRKEHIRELKQLKAELTRLERESFKGRKLPDDKYCLRKGEDKRPEYDGYLALTSSNDKQPLEIDNTGRGVVSREELSAIYAGCRVNAKVRLWPQDNTYGKRINARLISVQFAGDDEPLDSRHVSVVQAMAGFSDTGLDNTSEIPGDFDTVAEAKAEASDEFDFLN